MDRASIRAVVSRSIKQLPSQGIVYRETYNEYNSKIGLEEIAILEGLFYSEESSSLKDLVIEEAGTSLPKVRKNFLTAYSEETMKVQQGDYIKVDNEYYRIVNVGENMQIYCLMRLIKYDMVE